MSNLVTLMRPILSVTEFTNDRCAPAGLSNDAELTSFNRICYEFHVGKGGSFDEARAKCRHNNGDLLHGFKGSTTSFLIGELERRKDKMKTQLIWIGAQKEPGLSSRTWKWVDGRQLFDFILISYKVAGLIEFFFFVGEIIAKPSWGKDQPNNYNGEQNCVVLDGGRNWLWNDVGCNLDYLLWICQNSKLMNVFFYEFYSSQHFEHGQIAKYVPTTWEELELILLGDIDISRGVLRKIIAVF